MFIRKHLVGGKYNEKKLAIITLIIVVFLITSNIKKQEKIEIYSFSGENEAVTINNGLIIVTGNLEKFIGGDLSFKGEKPSDVKYSNTKFFFIRTGL